MILFESATTILPKVSAYAVHALQFPVPMAGGTAVDRSPWRRYSLSQKDEV
ncbi:hypothetical protein [Microcoleus sp. N3A4]|uniref:hypothetical protein n=1 Tax=Microcoleus sp. N3A4 TaxID=3055379 RepID=UPI002FD0B7CB